MKYNEKGSVTMIVAVTILFIVILLSSFLVYTSARRRAQIEETALISNAYDGDMDAIYNQKIASEDTVTMVQDVPIPKGFYYVGGTKEEGVVISDNQSDENKYQGQANVGTDDVQGNQFVWIPASGDNYLNSNDNQLYQIDSKIQEENQKIGESIQKYDGFYVSRFELANEGSNTVSKKGLTPSTNVTLQQAINNARAMYDETNLELGAASTLIYGKQWNLAMDYIDDEYNVSDSTSYGNYYNFVRNTNNLNLALNNKNNQIWKSFRKTTFKQAAMNSIIIETSTDKDNTIIEVPAKWKRCKT